MQTIQPNIQQLRMLASIRGELWAMRPESVSELALAALDAASKVPASSLDEDTMERLSMFYDLRKPIQTRNGYAVIDVRGGLVNKAPAIYEALGLVTKYSTIIEETEKARDMRAKGILYVVDSPGGTVSGLAEVGTAIRNVGIPTTTYATGLACSAAYYLAASTGKIFASESATVGNIGAILAWADCSAFWEAKGVQFKALTNEGADLKSTFHLEPDATQLAFLQDSINEAGANFRAWVEAGRKNIDPEVFRAGWYSGETAGALGLIDGVSTFSDVFSQF